MRTQRHTNSLFVAGLLIFAGSGFADSVATPRKDADKPAVVTSGKKILWEDPFATGARNLIYGSGGQAHQPASTVFDFSEEQMSGSTPKFKVIDSAGTSWKVKLGVEAKPETVATRFVWAAGYATDEDYFLPDIEIRNLPAHLHRGERYRLPGGKFKDARLERDISSEKTAGIWRWKDSSFVGTREWNGLRVLMGLINNWDVKDVNNSVYTRKSDGDAGPDARYIYVISDLGATFGPNRLDLGHKRNKGDLKHYARTHFVHKTRPDTVSFSAPAPPSLAIMILNPFTYIGRRRLTWIGHDIPRQDARWMGTILGRLTPGQIRDAFRAGGYSREDVEAFAAIVEKRIAALNEL